MECFKCHGESPVGSKFCSQCGKDFRTKSQTGNKETYENQTRISWPHAESVVAREKLLLQKSSHIVTSILGGLAIAAFSGAIFGFITFLVVGAVVAIFIVVFTSSTLSRNEYYALPLSKVGGSHRCIFCGGKGIYTKGVYASDTKENYCSNSQCGKFLYSS